MVETTAAEQNREKRMKRNKDSLMATHSSILAWRIPWTEEPGGLTRSQTRLQGLSMHVCMLSVWNLSFLTRDRTLMSPHWKGRVLTTGPPGKSRK